MLLLCSKLHLPNFFRGWSSNSLAASSKDDPAKQAESASINSLRMQLEEADKHAAELALSLDIAHKRNVSFKGLLKN